MFCWLVVVVVVQCGSGWVGAEGYDRLAGAVWLGLGQRCEAVSSMY